MIGTTRQVTVWAYGAAADLRRGFEGLSALVRQGLGQRETSGDLFLFVSRDRRRAKVLLWDGTGLCIYAKKLERGRFAALSPCLASRSVRLTMSELSLFLEGSRLVGKVALSPPSFVVEKNHF